MLSRAGSSAACVLLAAAVAALLAPGPAFGGSYRVAQCHQLINPVQGDAFAETSGPEYTVSAACGSGGGLSVSHPSGGTAGGAYGRWVWRAPDGTVFTSIEASAMLVGGPGEGATLAAVPDNGPTIAFGAPGAAWEPVDVLEGEFNAFRAGLACAGPALCPGGAGVTAAVRDVVLRTADRSPPLASITGGEMVGQLAIRGRSSVEFEVSDRGSGVHSLEVKVNGEAVDADTLQCEVSGDFAESLRPCPGAATRTQTLATADQPFVTGVNEVSVCGADLALDGVANSECASDTIFVDDVCPVSPVGTGSVLSAQFAGGRNKARVRSDQRVRLKGRLRTDSGTGIAGATICALVHTRLEGAPYELARTAVTDQQGGFRIKLPAGPSRHVYLHRAFGDQVLARHGLSTAASVRPSFEIRPSKRSGPVSAGSRLHFRGRLPGPECENRDVKIQAKIGKRRWQVFRSPTTDRSCRYRTRYKLGSTGRPTRYLFRARVRKQAGYPYAAGVSTVRARRAVPGR